MSPDSKLLKKAGKGNIDAFEKLALNYEKHIYNIAYRMLGNIEDARDASQEVLIKIYRNIDKCQDIKAVKGWISTITTNTCIDFLRRKKRITEMSFEADDDRPELQLVSCEPSPEEQAVYNEIRTDIAAALAKLPDNYRLLIVLRDINGLSYNEISASLDVQLGTVKSRLSRARNNLRLLLENQEQKKDPLV